MKVKSVMHKGIASLASNAGFRDVAAKMKELEVSSIPLTKNVERDHQPRYAVRCVANGKDLAKATAEDVMTPQVVFCHDTVEIEDAIRIMERSRFVGSRCWTSRSSRWAWSASATSPMLYRKRSRAK
jgi:predicted transcriptional regulator